MNLKTAKPFRGLLLLLLFLSATACNAQKPAGELLAPVKTGAHILLEKHLAELSGKRVGLVMNPTAVVEGRHMLDTLIASGVQISALFAPEHGFRGQAGAGEVIKNGVDAQTGIPVFSLYGQTKEPEAAMLAAVDVLLFDMQDIGTRYYTYNSTMGRVMQAAAKNGKELWILDRPNPLGGNYVAGWTLEAEFTSFVGMYPIPAAHGMTLGELARMILEENWLPDLDGLNLRIIAMEGWKRKMLWPDTRLPWIPPSPNIPTFETAFFYPATVFFEGTSFSEGRGTDAPFLLAGSPTFRFDEQAAEKLFTEYGIQIEPEVFVPVSIPGKAENPKYVNETCFGFRITSAPGKEMNPVALSIELLKMAANNDPEFETRPYLNSLAGVDLRSMMKKNVVELPKTEGEAFKKLRLPYLLYD